MDRETRILHTADTHLGYRQYHNEVRRQDFFRAFETVITDAVDMQVDAVVHAGDLFDSRNPTLEDLLETMNILSRLKAVNIPFFGIVGNHESKQNTQWLNLFEEMGLAVRLGKEPKLVGGGGAAIYGIDSVPKSRIPLYDYSGFEVPESLPENCRKLLVMHQIVQPFPFADWDCEEVLDNLPFKVDAILLGDYHEYEKIKVGDTWVTYPGSTERNSASESEPRSYNIITLSGEGLEISRRTIPTRDFLFIKAKLDGEEKPYEQIFSAVNEHLEELPESVVFLDISGESGPVLSFSEVEEYVLSKGALVAKVKDNRVKEGVPEEIIKVAFSDPDRAVAEEIRRMSLNDGGLIIDEVIRGLDVPRSRVDEETENRLSGLIESIDFKNPDFRVEIPINPETPVSSVSAISPASPANPIIHDSHAAPISSSSVTIPATTGEPEGLELPGMAGNAGTLEPAGGTEFTAAAVTGKSEIPKASARIQRSESLNESLNKNFETPVETPDKVLESSDSISNSSDKSPGSLPAPTTFEIAGESEERHQPGTDPGNKTQTEAGKQSVSGVETSPEKDGGSKTEELPDGKPLIESDRTSKPVKQSQRKTKRKPAVPRQYNLGDYL